MVGRREIIAVTCMFVLPFSSHISSSDISSSHNMARTRMSARKVTGGSAPRSNWQRAPTAYRKPSKPQAPEVSRPEEPAPDNTSDAENVNFNFVNSLELTHKLHQGCCICLNGGNLIVCSRCPRVCCDGCIPMVLKENDVHLDNETVWLCPSCHVTSTRAAPDCRATPYFVSFEELFIFLY